MFGYGVVRPMNARRWGGPSAGWDMAYGVFPLVFIGCSSIPWWPVEATNNQTCKYHNECVSYQCNCKYHNAATSPLMPPIWMPHLNRVLSYRLGWSK